MFVCLRTSVITGFLLWWIKVNLKTDTGTLISHEKHLPTIITGVVKHKSLRAVIILCHWLSYNMVGYVMTG